MDEAEFDVAIDAARDFYVKVKTLMERPAEWADWYNKSLESGGPQSQLSALLEEARHPDRRSQIAAQAANLIGQRLDPGTEPIEAAKRRGPPPDGLAARDLAAIAAMWFLSEKFGEPVTRNDESKPLSPCDAVSFAVSEVEDKEKGYGYKNFARLWNNRARLIRKNPLLIMAFSLALPSASYLGIRSADKD